MAPAKDSLSARLPGGAPEPGGYYPSPLHQEAMARLAYLAGKGSACGLLLGPAGTGKSLVLSRFAKEQRRAGSAVAHVNAVGRSAAEILAQIGPAWEAFFRSEDQVSSRWQRTVDRLCELAYEQVPAILLVDDLCHAAADGIALLDRLQANVEASGANLVVVGACTPESSDLLSPRFVERCELRLELDAWTLEETSCFLQQWLTASGIEDDDFEEAAIDALHLLSGGIPRRVRQLAELVLLAGSGTGAARLDESLVQAAFDELSVGR